jgi:hypothetical protein
VHLPAVEEMVVLERIELIARLGVCYESQAKDKDIALIWISELAGEMKTSIAPEKARSDQAACRDLLIHR